MKEMRRFLPATVVGETLEKASYWQYLTQLFEEGRQGNSKDVVTEPRRIQIDKIAPQPLFSFLYANLGISQQQPQKPRALRAREAH
ncbi:MAG: hypothetical protein PHD76_13715 [Methylacidiphilales bacterium]|nr:hypothetical protein [Candidatus Methylacidiphilales bacterium]